MVVEARKKLPVLLLTFTKVEQTAKVLAAIAAYAPTHLYIAQDGPREGHATDAEKVKLVKEITEKISWPCEVITRRQTENMGLKKHVESSISWFFSQEKAGVILEDDTMPTPDFFTFCEQMLHRYETDKRVFLVAGTNLNYPHQTHYSYFFTKEPIIWGWASWADRWAHYDETLQQINDTIPTRDIHLLYQDQYRAEVEINKIKQIKNNDLSSWATAWGYTIRLQNGCCVVPTVNLVTNIGFIEDASHTTDKTHPLSNLQTEKVTWPLVHPAYFILSSVWENRFFYPGQQKHKYISFKELLLVGYYKAKSFIMIPFTYRDSKK